MVYTGADYYDPDWMPGIKLFDSWEHLINLLQEVNTSSDSRPYVISHFVASKVGTGPTIHVTFWMCM